MEKGTKTAHTPGRLSKLYFWLRFRFGFDDLQTCVTKMRGSNNAIKPASTADLLEVLTEAVRWNEEYKTINHLRGDPHWVSWAKHVIRAATGTEV